jgi:cyclopropane fatty-acyl-phospholipid synthase-like methyltransferase
MHAESTPETLPHGIFGILQSLQRTAALTTAVQIDLFTAIGDSGSSPDDIAAHCNTSARGVRVLCDYICVLGLLQKRLGRYWQTREAALYLDRRSPHFIGDAAVQMYAGGPFVEGCQHLTQAVRSGGTALASAGTLAPEHPYWVQFARARGAIGAANGRRLATLLDSSSSGTMRVLDIACGHGHHGIAIAKANPRAQIFAQDWPAVLDVAVGNAREAGVLERYHTIPGDVFGVTFRERYDMVLITNFLPDFGPAECERLLTKIRHSLTNNGRAVALQWIPDDDRLSPPTAPSLALSLLAETPSGDVYTYRELVEMFRRAGFTRTELRELGPSLQRVVIGHH